MEEDSMKRKTVTAFLMSLCLVLTVPGTAYASEIQSVAAEAQSAATEVQVQAAEEEPPEDPEAGQEEKKEETPAEEKNEVAKAGESQKGSQKTGKKDTREQSGETGNDVQDTLDQITAAVEAAKTQEKPDMSSDEMKDFVAAMQAYEKLSKEDRQKLSDSDHKGHGKRTETGRGSAPYGR